MAWNEPGGGDNRDDDPWGKKKKKGGGPPDLDEILKTMRDKFRSFFGGKGGGGNGSQPSGGGSGGPGMFSVTIVIILALTIWAMSGFYTVDETQKAVVQRFGQFDRVTNAGLSYHLPYPIEKKTLVPIKVEGWDKSAIMLTKDNKLVKIELNIQYRVTDPKKYLFFVNQPVKTLHNSVESALRESVGKRDLESILGVEELDANKALESTLVRCLIKHDKEGIEEIKKIIKAAKDPKSVVKKKIAIIEGKPFAGRSQLRDEIKKNLQKLLKTYNTGIKITLVNFGKPKPPTDKVDKAFDDVNSAKLDSQTYVQRAWEYCSKIVNKAQGEKSRIVKDAEGYKKQKIVEAEGEVSRYLQVLAEYEKAPEVVRKRLYIETQERVMARVNKIMVKTKSGNNVLFLPLDKYLRQGDSEQPGSKLSDNKR